MGLFTGVGSADEVITPTEVSPSVLTTTDARPSAANDTINGGAGSDTIDGGRGDDVIDGGIAADLINGGDGADTIIWNPGGGSDTVDGGRGQDVLQFNMSNAAETIGLSAQANGHLLLTRDIAAIAMDVDNVERIAFGGGSGGADRFVIGDLSTTDVKKVEIDLGFTGADSQVDRVEVSGLGGDDRLVLTTDAGVTTVKGLTTDLSIAHGEVTDVLAFSGGTGNDTVDASALGGGLAISFDGGEGADVFLIKGDPNAASTIFLAGNAATNMQFGINNVFSQGQLTGVETIQIQGGQGGDTIIASSFLPGDAGVVINGGNGADTITNSAGADTVNGGGGDDLINGGRGNDVLNGQGGNDTFTWNPGDGSDSLDGGAGHDTLQFNMANIAENISVFASADGHAHVTRNVANISMDLTSVERLALGGAGAGGVDLITIGDLTGSQLRNIDIDLGPNGPDLAVDRVEASGLAGDDRLVLTAINGVTSVGGLAADLSIAHAEAQDVFAFAGGTGNDTVDASANGGGVSLTFDGGEGSDVFLIKGDGAIFLAGNADTAMQYGVNNAFAQATLTGVETISIQGGQGGDSIIASSFLPGAASVVISGGNGADTITNSAGADTVNGGGGDDLINGGRGNDVLNGQGGADTFTWNPGDGSDSLDGGAGQDTLQFNAANIAENISVFASADGHAHVTRNVANINMDLTSVERLAFGGGSGGADVFTIGDLSPTGLQKVEIDLGFTGADSQVDRVEVSGLGGDDRLVLSTDAGVTTVKGLTTDLSIAHGEVTDVLAFFGGTGADTVDASALAGGVAINFDGGEGSDVFLVKGDPNAASTIVLAGNAATTMEFGVNNVFSQGQLTNVETIQIQGGQGGDTIIASSFLPGAAGVVINGGNGADTITNSAGADTVNGGAGDDLLNGGRGNDVLNGGSGDDTFTWNPGDGSDVLNGGAGTDTLQFNMANIAEVIEVADIGGAVVTRNVAGITMSLDSVEHIRFGGGAGGADTFFFGDLSTTAIRQIDVDLGQRAGDGAADTVSVLGSAKNDSIAITGAGGSATVDGSPADVTVAHADAGDALTVSGLDGADRFDLTGFAGGIDLRLWGGTGSDRFTFGPSAGANVQVMDFQAHLNAGAEGDVVSLLGFPDADFASALAHNHIVQSGADVVVSDDHGVIATLQNVLLTDLSAKDFVFG